MMLNSGVLPVQVVLPGGPTRRRGSLHPIVVGHPLQLVAVDILGPLPQTSDGNAYILVGEDYFTR